MALDDDFGTRPGGSPARRDVPGHREDDARSDGTSDAGSEDSPVREGSRWSRMPIWGKVAAFLALIPVGIVAALAFGGFLLQEGLKLVPSSSKGADRSSSSGPVAGGPTGRPGPQRSQAEPEAAKPEPFRGESPQREMFTVAGGNATLVVADPNNAFKGARVTNDPEALQLLGRAGVVENETNRGCEAVLRLDNLDTDATEGVVRFRNTSFDIRRVDGTNTFVGGIELNKNNAQDFTGQTVAGTLTVDGKRYSFSSKWPGTKIENNAIVTRTRGDRACEFGL